MSPNGKSLADVAIPARRASNDLLTMKISTLNDKPTKPFERKLVWKNVVVYVLGHALGLYGLKYALFDFSWTHVIMFAAVGYFIGLNGILVGAHRHYAHKTFKASKAMQVLMLIANTACSQNCMWVWVRDHRQHHMYSDTDADPHNASNGFFFSHVGWLLSKKHPDVIEKGKEVNMADINADPLVMFQKRHYVALWFIFTIILPNTIVAYVSGEPLMKCFVLWTATRLVVSLNFTWMVNSWAHLYGTKPFDKNIRPVETYLVSLVTGGEGWHNYHHTFPWDYRAAELGTPLNIVASYIRFCARHGLVWDLKTASAKTTVSRASRTGDGTPLRTKVFED